MIFDEHEDSSANVTDLLPEERRELLVETFIMNARVAMLGIAGTMETTNEIWRQTQKFITSLRTVQCAF